MPKARRPNPYDKLTALIAGAKAVQRMTMDDVSASTGISRSRLLELNRFHVEFVLDCMKENTTEIRNIRAYLLTALYNAPFSMGSYYAAKVRHDLRGGDAT